MDGAVGSLDDAEHGGQAETSTLAWGFGGEKGVEEIVENISSHPDARVGDLEEDKAAEDRTRFERLLRRGADVLDGEAKASATIEFRIIE